MRMCRRLGTAFRGERRVPITFLSGYGDNGAMYPRVGIYYYYTQTWYNTRVEFELKRSAKKLRLDCQWTGGNYVPYTTASLFDADVLPEGRTFYTETRGRIAYGQYTFEPYTEEHEGYRFAGHIEFEGDFRPGRYAICIMVTDDTWQGKNISAANEHPQDGDFVVTATM